MRSKLTCEREELNGVDVVALTLEYSDKLHRALEVIRSNAGYPKTHWCCFVPGSSWIGTTGTLHDVTRYVPHVQPS